MRKNMTAEETQTETRNLMASTWTQAAKARRAFNAGPRRKSDLKFDDLEGAVLATYASFLDLRKEMKKAVLPTRDVRAALVLMTAAYEGPPFNAGVGSLLAIPDTIEGLPDLLREAEKRTKNGAMAPLGVAFWQRDKDPRAKTSKTAWVQSWRVDPRLQLAADTAREAFEESDGRVPEDGLNETFAEVGEVRR